MLIYFLGFFFFHSGFQRTTTNSLRCNELASLFLFEGSIKKLVNNVQQIGNFLKHHREPFGTVHCSLFRITCLCLIITICHRYFPLETGMDGGAAVLRCIHNARQRQSLVLVIQQQLRDIHIIRLSFHYYRLQNLFYLNLITVAHVFTI